MANYYRVWNKKENKMYYDVMISSGSEKLAYRVDKESSSWIEMDYNDLIIMRALSKKQNGDTIYDGDIVEEDDQLYLVVWRDYKFILYGFYSSFFEVSQDAFSETTVKLKGNRYENPELINDVVDADKLKIMLDL
ncbi:YopX family protein [Paraclostridium bifermentans]|uniref:YopX family protein n=1 Tax=Paraclostridium bifermentans TaxID=1490 RepID=UPI00374EEB05